MLETSTFIAQYEISYLLKHYTFYRLDLGNTKNSIYFDNFEILSFTSSGVS